MQQQWLQMGMPISLRLNGNGAKEADIAAVQEWFALVDDLFSTYKPTSQISLINSGQLRRDQADQQVQLVLDLCERTKRETEGYFSIETPVGIDPSGLVKGWAIEQAATLLRQRGQRDFYIEAGGDVIVDGMADRDRPWRVGIRHPWQHDRWVKVVQMASGGVATSGTSARGGHITDPHTGRPVEEIVSLTVIAPTIYEADRLATAAFAMGSRGLDWLADRSVAAYMIDACGIANWTESFELYVVA